MNRSGRLPLLAAALAAAALLPGCPAWTRFCKTIRLCSRDTFTTPDAVPPDFQFVLHGDNLKDPPIDYLLRYDRSGEAEYRVTIREPRRIERTGRFEVMEGQIFKLWEAVKAADYGNLDARYPSSGEGPDTSWGIQRFMVRSEDFPKEVQAHYQQEPALERLRMLAISMLPDSVIEQFRKDVPEGTGTLGVVIGDTETKRFYAPDSPLLKEVPEERRQTFRSWYDALNFGFDPSPDWRTPRDKDDR